jgi:hypothetical protein
MRIKVEREPTAWTSIGIGLVDMSSIQDRESESDWEFGQGIQYRVSLEKALRGGSGLGVVATFAQMPLTYQRRGTVIGSEPCDAPCDATANIWSLSGGFHMGGGMGLHQVIQLNIGATMFGNFREDATGDALPPSEIDVDLSFNVGYGIGFTLSPRVQASLVQEFGFIMHPGNGSGGSSSAVQSRVMRLGIRYGLGQKRPGV